MTDQLCEEVDKCIIERCSMTHKEHMFNHNCATALGQAPYLPLRGSKIQVLKRLHHTT